MLIRRYSIIHLIACILLIGVFLESCHSSEQVTTYKPSRKRSRKKHRKKKKEQQLAIKVIQQDGDETKLKEEEETGEKELTNTLIEKDKQIILATPQVIGYESSARPPVQPVIVRDKGKEKLKNKVDKVEKEIDTVGLSASRQRSSLELFEEYFNAVFKQPVTSVEAYMEFRKNHLENLQIQFTNLNNPALIQTIMGRLQLIKLNRTLGDHLKNILTAGFFDEIDKENKFELVQLFYTANLSVAILCLTSIRIEYLAYKSQQKNNFRGILEYIATYKQAREELTMYWGLQKNSFPNSYSLTADQLYDELICSFPELVCYFELSLNSNITPATFKRLHQLETQARFRQKHGIPSIAVNQNNEQASRFNLPVAQFYNKVCEQVFDVINQPDDCTLLSIEKAKQAFEQFVTLENEGIEVVASVSQPDVYMNNLTAQGLVGFYKELAELMPYLNICMFITRGIELSIKAREFEIGLERLRAIEDFYTSYPNLFPAGSEPGFRSYQAKAYALCGNYDKLSELYKNEILKVLAQKRKLAIQHQRKVEKIKRIQQASLTSLAPTKLASERGIEKEEVSTTKIEPRILPQIGSQEKISQAAYAEREQLLEQEIENRHKRHQEAEEQRKRGELIEKPTCSEETQVVSEKNPEVTARVHAPSIPQIPSDIHFLLPKRAFKTISKIFTNNWKITRADIENLFEFLGHNIDKATKSSHHIIIISQGITLVRGEEIIGIITDLSATMGGHLSLPSWDKEIPFYMRPQIENLLRAIGINQDNYSKGNSEDYMEFVSVDKNNKHK